MIDILSWVFLLGGAFFLVSAGIGLLRLPDVFTRLHGAGMADTMGVALTTIGLMLQAGLSLVTLKLLLIWLFIWFTSPVAGHSVARSALVGGERPVLHPRDPQAAAAAAASARQGDAVEGRAP